MVRSSLPPQDEPADPARHDRPLTRLRRIWWDASLRRKLFVAVALPLAWLLPAGVLAAVIQDRQADLRLEIRADNEALAALRGVELGLVDAETGMRGYLATGDPDLLEPYEASAAALDGSRADLRDALVDDDRAVELERDASRALAAVRSLVDAAPAPGAVRTAAVIAAKDRMDEARAAVQELEAQVRAQLVDHRAEADALTRRAELVAVSGILVGAVAGLASVLLITNGITRRVTAVERNARRLARGEPLEATPPSCDELGRMTDELLRTSMLLERRAQDMARSRDDALRATRAKDQFLSRMSHELRTPLTSILGFGQLLQMEDLRPDDRAAVDQIVRSGQHLLGLINEVLDIARIESGHLSLSLEPVDLGAVVADCLTVMGPQAETAGVRLHQEGGGRAMADQQRVKQVVLNLVSNAIKYNAAEMRVNVVVEDRPGGTTRISVTDTGMGIGTAARAKLFEPFERLGADATGIEGTGVGLALSRTLVEAMGGTIGVESERGRGSTFWVDLPTAGAEAEAIEGDAVAPVDDDRPVVVYVDDNRANLELMERIFRERPERLVTAMQGSAARDLARRLRPVVLLVDLHLPDIGGEDLVRLLRADPATRATPIVVVSADATEGRDEMLEALGVAHRLEKPLDVDRLAAVLAELADARVTGAGHLG